MPTERTFVHVRSGWAALTIWGVLQPSPPVLRCCSRFSLRFLSFELRTDGTLWLNWDFQHCLLRETEGISNQDTFRSYSHQRSFSLIPAVKVLFLSDPHNCSSVTKFLATCKAPPHLFEAEKSPGLCLEGCEGDCPHSSRQGGHCSQATLGWPSTTPITRVKGAAGQKWAQIEEPSLCISRVWQIFQWSSHLKHLGH